jgi:hypothetical protein
MNKTIKVICVLLLPLLLSACSTVRWCNTHPDWNPPQGYEWAKAKCKAQASKTSGYDWAESAINKNKAYDKCMASYGYEQKDTADSKEKRKICE